MDHLKQYFAKQDDVVSTEAADLDVLASEVEQATVSCESVSDDVDRLVTAADSMERLQTSMEGLLDGEDATGLGHQAAVFAQGWGQATMESLGIDVEPAVSLESFGSEADSLEATQVSVEDVKGKLKQIWEAIKNAVKKAIKAIGDLLAKIFGGVGKLKQKALAVQKEAKEAKGSPKEDKIKVTGAQFLHFEGKVEFADIQKGQERMKQMVGDIYGDWTGVVIDIYGIMQKAANSQEDPSAELEKEIAKLDDIAGKGDALPGGKEFTVLKKGKEDSKLNPIRYIPKVQDAEGKGPSESSPEIKAPQSGDIEKLAGTIVDICDAIDKKKDAVKKMTDARENAMKAVDKAVADSDSGKIKGAAEKAVVNLVMRGVQSNMGRPVAQITSAAFSGGRSAVSLCETALKNLAEK